MYHYSCLKQDEYDRITYLTLTVCCYTRDSLVPRPHPQKEERV